MHVVHNNILSIGFRGNSMKVLFCIRSDYLSNFAGDSVQVINTAKYLRKLGVEVHINTGDIFDYSSYDIIHLFNLTRMGETYRYYKLAHHYRKPVVLSPIYWNLKKFYLYKNDTESIKLWDKCIQYRREILRGSVMVYPSSYMEAYALKMEFGNEFPYTVIYNAVEPFSDDIPIYNFCERYSLDKYILCVGRICERKNQLELIRAGAKLGVQVVLIGDAKDKGYLEQCLKFKGVRYLGFMDSYDLYSAYKFAKVHVLPSFVETPGLTSLEAASYGCNIVTTIEGSGEEYFKDEAIYVNPYNEGSIESGLEEALIKKKRGELKEHVRNNFNVEKCSKVLYSSYQQISL